MLVFLKIIKESLFLSLQQLWANRLRTILSLLGVTIGIFSIIAILTAVDSMKADIENDISKLGDDLVIVQKWPFYTGGSSYPYWKYFQRPQPSYKDYEYLEERSQTIGAITYTLMVPDAVVSLGSRKLRGLEVFGTTLSYDKVINVDIQYGRYFTPQEMYSGYHVAIIGADAAEKLFEGKQDILGEEVMVDNIKVKIIGVIKKAGQGVLGLNDDKSLIMPYELVNKSMSVELERANPNIWLIPNDQISADAMIAEVSGLMRNIRHLRPKQLDDFTLSKFSIITNTFQGMLGALSTAGWVIGGLSLLVGGFGIANIMYVSVKERTNIIGIKMAMGAKSIYILLEFLFESVLLCLFGGGIGLFIIYLILNPISEASGFQFVLTMKNVSIGLGVSAFIGVLAGILPAIKASNLDPVEAIRAN
ncbi:MAG: ABC transporter permease [Chitinophagales bacterium]